MYIINFCSVDFFLKKTIVSPLYNRLLSILRLKLRWIFFFISFGLYRFRFSQRVPNWAINNVSNTFREPSHRIITKWKQWSTLCVAWAGAIFPLYTKKAIMVSRWVFCFIYAMLTLRYLYHKFYWLLYGFNSRCWINKKYTTTTSTTTIN